MPYVDPDLNDDETAVAEGNLAAARDIVDGWEPAEGDPETALFEATGTVQATAMAEIKSLERNNYAGFGDRILRLTRGAAEPARSQVTITFDDDAGHLVPAGFEVVFATIDGDSVPVATTIDAVAAPGATEVTAVPVAALEPGTGGNGATGASIDREDLSFVAAVTLEQPTSGGVDEEPLTEYLDEAVAKSERISFLPLTPSNYAAVALEVPGVARAITLNRHDPATAPADAPGHITIRAADADGANLSGAKKTELETYVTSTEQLLGAVPHIEDPTTVAIDVAVTVRKNVGFTDPEVETAVETAVRALLNKATWNYDNASPGKWRKGAGQVTVYDIDRVLDDLSEVLQVVTVTLNGAGTPITVAAEALAYADDVAVTVTA